MTPRRGPGESRRRKSLGDSGESVARAYLEKEGYRIFRTNYRLRGGEIDIVAYKSRVLAFCEVKTRLGESNPLEGYSETQQRRMVKTGEAYLREYRDLLPKVFDLRYDVIIVGDGPDGVLEVREHIEDAFRPA